MRQTARFGICSSIVFFCLAFWMVGLANAEMSDVCRDLAARFADPSQQLDLNSLASLLACVTTELQDRVVAAPIPPQPVRQVAPPPPPPPPAPEQQTPPPPRQEWGAWPSPAPWGVYPPQSSPWDK